MNKVIKIEGLDCANCARELEEELNGIDGIKASVDFMNMRILLEAETPAAHDKAVRSISGFEEVKIVEGGPVRHPVRERLKDLVCLIVATMLFVPALVLDLTGTAWQSTAARAVTYVLYGLSYLTAGHTVLINTAKNIIKGKIFDENFLMTLASAGAVLLGIFAGEGFFEGVAVMLLYMLGELLQGIAVGASRRSIAGLMDLKSDAATILDKDGGKREVTPAELRVGDIILIKAGEKVPADCKIVKGSSSFDLKSLNGEPVLKDAAEGDEVLSGSINLSGVVEAEVIREYKDSAVAKIMELVENSSAKKSAPEKFITKFAKYYTPAVCAAAVLAAALVPTVICAVNSAFVWETYRGWIYKALTFLVISCPCALVISVPLSYFGGIGRCAKSGILVKGSTCLDELALATSAAFDKTGTLTEGKFAVRGYSSRRALELAAAAEKFSSHPIAAAFEDIKGEYVVTNAEEIAGKGIKCLCGGKTLLCGNAALLGEYGVEFTPAESLSTVIYVALNGEYVGYAEVDDKIKAGAKQAVDDLKAGGITYTAMLTGDSAARAGAVACETGVDECFAGLLPDDKLREAQKIKERGKLIYVGDGINDAPVMTVADCAVSMGKAGSDAAIEASDVVIISDNLSLLPKGRKIAKATRRIVIQNIAGSLAVKLAVMVCGLAVAGFPLIVSVAADVGVMLIAVLNAMRTSLIK